MNTFLGIFAGVTECSFVQNSCILWLGLVILWPKVAKNYGIAKIRVFLGRIFGVFSGPRWQRNMAFPKFVSFCMLKFHSVGELSCRGGELEIKCQIAYPSVTGKVQNLWKSKTYFGQFWCASSTHCPNLNLLHAGGRAESAL